MPTRIAVAYAFTPLTVNRLEQLIRYHEVSRTALVERLIKNEYEALLLRYHTPPASIDEMHAAAMAALVDMYAREQQAQALEEMAPEGQYEPVGSYSQAN